ncbi:MAG: sigma-E processing peptidase SpoIIGA [Clostridia bacterium]|nr:sigma-E processing peptidase SpoIIGA [Clostridia bacterium]
MVLYIDSAIFSGFLLNFLCLDTAAGVLGVTIKKRRTLTGAFALSLLSVFSLFLPWIKFIYIFVYIYAVRLILGKCSAPELIRRTGICVCVCLLYSAILLTVIPPDKIQIISVSGGNFFVPDDLWFYLPLGAVYALVKVIMFLVSRTKQIYPVRIQIDGKAVVTKAFIDTGNSLRDPETGFPVIIAERSLFEEILSQPKIIKYKNIGSDRNYTKIYPVERICLLEERRVYENVYAALTDKPLNRVGAYRILLHNSFLERK